MMSLGGNHGGLGFGTLPSTSAASTLSGIGSLGLPNFSSAELSMLLQNSNHLQALAKVQELHMQQSALHLQRFASPLRSPAPTATVTKDTDRLELSLLDNSHTTSPTNSSLSTSPLGLSPPAAKQLKYKAESSPQTDTKQTGALPSPKLNPSLFPARSSPVFPGLKTEMPSDSPPIVPSRSANTSQSPVSNGNSVLANQMAALAAQQQSMQLLSQPDSVSMAMIGSYHKALGQGMQAEPNQASSIARAIALSQTSSRRPRSEKKAIPDELKDTKYFERRKRNNQAAKKSRDARKAREDEIAIRASFLEKENAILRAQVATLREEANSLRHLLLQKRSRQG